MKYKTKGIVFNFVKFRESSVIARIYTAQFGLKNYIINNVRSSKPRYPVSYFQPMTLLDMVVYNKNHADINRIAEIKCWHPYKSIPYNVIKSSVALFITEILYKTLREEEANPELYNFMEESLLFYDNVQEPSMNFHLQFLFKYARFQGIEPLKTQNHTRKGPGKENNGKRLKPDKTDLFQYERNLYGRPDAKVKTLDQKDTHKSQPMNQT